MSSSTVLLKDAIYTLLNVDSIFASIPDGTSDVRIYRDRIPNGVTYPAAVYYVISPVRDHLLPTRRDRVQFDFYAEDPDEVEELADLVNTILQRYKGTVGSFPIIQVVNDNEFNSPAEFSTETWRKTIDYIFFYKI